MMFLADEGLDFSVVDLLRKNDFKVIYAAEEMKGALDVEILQRALKEKCILITKDKDFGEMVIRKKMHSAGIILVRIERLNDQKNSSLVVDLIKKYSSDILNSFTVIQEDKIRIRSFDNK